MEVKILKQAQDGTSQTHTSKSTKNYPANPTSSQKSHASILHHDSASHIFEEITITRYLPCTTARSPLGKNLLAWGAHGGSGLRSPLE